VYNISIKTLPYFSDTICKPEIKKMRKTKIIATVGPACENSSNLKAMFKAGVNVCRLNFSFGSHEQHAD
jgi:pyruvate kinase